MIPFRLLPLTVSSAKNDHIIQTSYSNGEQFWYGPSSVELLTARTIDRVIQDVANQIRNDRKEDYVQCMISILKGGTYFHYRLLQAMPDTSFLIGNIGRTSYREGTRAGGLYKTYPLDIDPNLVRGADVWLVDDVMDSGNTIQDTVRELEELLPRSIRIVVLVNKIQKDHHNIQHAIYSGFQALGDQFIVGCGMGYGERFRTLPCLYELQTIIGDDQKENEKCSS